MIADFPVVFSGFVNVCFIYFEIVLLTAYSFSNIYIYVFFITSCQWHFIFSFQHPVLQLSWPFLPRCQRAGHWHEANTSEPLKFFSNDSSFFLPIDIPYGHNRSCQLGGQFEFLNRAVSLLGS